MSDEWFLHSRIDLLYVVVANLQFAPRVMHKNFRIVEHTMISRNLFEEPFRLQAGDTVSLIFVLTR